MAIWTDTRYMGQPPSPHKDYRLWCLGLPGALLLIGIMLSAWVF